MWGMPFGLGIAIFAPELVHYVIGEKWHFALDTIRAFGLVAAFDQIGFNWTAYLRALNQTRPLAMLGAVNIVVFLSVTVPLLVIFGINGFAVGWLAIGAATLASRAYFIRRVFPRFRMSRQAARALAPCLPALAFVLALRMLAGSTPPAAMPGAEVAGYLIITAVASAALERTLVREVLGYLRPEHAAVSLHDPTAAQQITFRRVRIPAETTRVAPLPSGPLPLSGRRSARVARRTSAHPSVARHTTGDAGRRLA